MPMSQASAQANAQASAQASEQASAQASEQASAQASAQVARLAAAAGGSLPQPVWRRVWCLRWALCLAVIYISAQHILASSSAEQGHSGGSQGKRSSYGVILEAPPGHRYADAIRAFQRGDYRLASQIFIDNRYTAAALGDPYYRNWLLKSLLAARRLELVPQYFGKYLQNWLPPRTEGYDSELYYLIGRYYFAIGKLRTARKIFINYLERFPHGKYVPQSYYWIGRSLERQQYFQEARALYLLVISYFSEHYLSLLAKRKAETISLYLLKQQAEGFLRSRGVEFPL